MSINSSIQPPIFLVDSGDHGGHSVVVVNAFVEFVKAAKSTLHIAIYDFQLDGKARQEVVEAIHAAAKRGVDVKIAYDHTKTENTATLGKGILGSDPAPRGTMAFVQANFPDLPTKPIAGSHLMHNKYIIRDGSDVWMGSANFTTSAWTRQENNILRLHSKELAKHYEEDFKSLWESGDIRGTGKNDYGALEAGGAPVEFAFCPGEGSAAASLFVDSIQGAGKTLWLSSMVISSGPILGALVDYLKSGGKIRGVYDATQMHGVEKDWQPAGKPVSPKLALWLEVKSHLVGKHSAPYSETSVHDFMHNKLLVTENTVVTGSFNLSRNAESNAENALSLKSKKLCNEYIDYIERLIEKYS